MKVIVHGGAGGAPDEPEPRQAVLDEAAAAGARVAAGMDPAIGTDAATGTNAAIGSPLDAVEAAVRVLESSPRFNAGVGGAVQSDGEVRTDAGVMTSDRAVGAVCSMPGVEHAVSAARAVLEHTPHVLVSGEHAVDLAADFGVETGVDLWTERTRRRWADLDSHPEGSPRAHLDWLRDRFGGTDTVGAVATDGEQIAAATSTGGRWLALAGRVGDVPQVGSGFYASPAGGASTTGHGEDIARVTLARRAVRHLETGDDPETAAGRAIEAFGESTDGAAGVIVLDAKGDHGSAYNSEAMQTAAVRE